MPTITSQQLTAAIQHRNRIHADMSTPHRRAALEEEHRAWIGNHPSWRAAARMPDDNGTALHASGQEV